MFACDEPVLEGEFFDGYNHLKLFVVRGSAQLEGKLEVDFRHTKRYAQFRGLLGNAELDNFRAVLSNRIAEKQLEEGATEFKLRGPKPFRVTVYRDGERLWLLGGHWERKGEPTEALKRYLQQAFLRLKAGIAPDDDI